MKRILMLVGMLVSIATVQVVFGQTNEGVITYEVKINMHRRLTGSQEGMKAMVPEFRTSKEQLFFNANESLYKPLIEDEDEATGSGDGMRVQIRRPMVEVYQNPSTGSLISKQEFFGKDYLIIDTIKVSPWKFGTETKEIQGYICKQAYYLDESQPDRKLDVTAWYTDQLRPMMGPERFGTLPGTILAIDVNNAERVIVAKKVELRPLKKNELKTPSSGQKTTQKEFRKMADEQIKKMGGSNGMVIRN
jgi:GLPGLI family protein